MTDVPGKTSDGNRTAIVVAVITAVGGIVAALIPIVSNMNAKNQQAMADAIAPAAMIEPAGDDEPTPLAEDANQQEEAAAADPTEEMAAEEESAPKVDEGVLLYEDFEGDADISDWIVRGVDDDTVVEIIDDGTGNHVLSIKAGEWWVAVAKGSRDWENYVLEVHGKLVEAEDDSDNGSGRPALVAAVRVNYTNECWRMLWIIMDPYNIFSARTGFGSESSEDCMWDQVGAFDPYFQVAHGRWYDLRVEVFGSLVRAYVDGELAQDFTFEDLEKGHIAVLARGQTTAYYDDFRVTELATP